jgi:nucleoside-diphosphate-sugar epimerase
MVARNHYRRDCLLGYLQEEMKVLVVGGAGYVGGALTDRLIKSEHDFVVYDNLSYEESYRKPVDFIYGDIQDHDKLRPILNHVDVVIWLAARVGDAACDINPEASIAINQESVKWLSDTFNGRIIALSTCSVYGARDGILNEDSPLNPLSIYAITKLEAEKYLRNKNAIIFRLGTLFGIGDTYSRIRLDLVVNSFTVKAHRIGKIQLFGGNQYRPLLHVRDAAEMIFKSIESDNVGIYNLHKENLTMSQLACNISEFFPNLIIEKAGKEFDDRRNYRVESNKAMKIGFNPKLKVSDGIREIKELLDNNRLKDINNPRYTNYSYLIQEGKL